MLTRSARAGKPLLSRRACQRHIQVPTSTTQVCCFAVLLDNHHSTSRCIQRHTSSQLMLSKPSTGLLSSQDSLYSDIVSGKSHCEKSTIYTTVHCTNSWLSDVSRSCLSWSHSLRTKCSQVASYVPISQPRKQVFQCGAYMTATSGNMRS